MARLRAALLFALVAACASRPVTQPVSASSPPTQAPRPDSELSFLSPLDSGVSPAIASPDGAHVAFLVDSPRGRRVIADGERHAMIDQVLPADTTMSWSERGGRLAYWAVPRGGRSPVLMVDGREMPLDGQVPFAREGLSELVPLAAPTLSPDGRRVAASARATHPRGTRTIVWIDGHIAAQFVDPVTPSGGVQHPVTMRFSPDGRHLAVVKRNAAEWAVWVDGWQRGGYEDLDVATLGWGPEGKVRFAGVREGANVLFADDREVEVAGRVAAIASSERGKLAYVIPGAGQQQLVMDDRIIATHDAITALRFEAERLTYVASDRGVLQIVLQGVGQSRPLATVGSFAWRADGRCVVYTGRALDPSIGAGTPTPSSSIWVIRESVGPPGGCRTMVRGPFDAVGLPRFAPEGSRSSAGYQGVIAFMARAGDRTRLHLPSVQVDVGEVPANLLEVSWSDDGRVGHYGSASGQLARVLRAPGDPVSMTELIERASRETQQATGLHETVVATFPVGERITPLVHDRSQRVAWIAERGAARTFTLDQQTYPLDAGGQVLLGETGRFLWGSLDAARSLTVVHLDGEIAAELAGPRVLAFAGPDGWIASRDPAQGPQVYWSARGRDLTFGATSPAQLIPSPDGQRLAIVTREVPPQVLLDDQPLARGTVVDEPRFSPDSRHLMMSVLAPEGGGLSLMVDGTVVRRSEDRLQALGFDSENAPVYTEAFAGGVALVAAGRPGTLFRSIAPASVVFDASHRHVAYVGLERSGGQPIVMLDRRELRADLAEPAGLTFSPDGGRLAWVASVAGSRAVLVDQDFMMAYDEVDPASLRWSPDGHRLAWVAGRRDRAGRIRRFVVIDGVEHGGYDEVAGTAVFGPAGHVAWLGRQRGTWSVVVDGSAVTTADDLAGGALPTWGPDGALQLTFIRHRSLVGMNWTPTRLARGVVR